MIITQFHANWKSQETCLHQKCRSRGLPVAPGVAGALFFQGYAHKLFTVWGAGVATAFSMPCREGYPPPQPRSLFHYHQFGGWNSSAVPLLFFRLVPRIRFNLSVLNPLSLPQLAFRTSGDVGYAVFFPRMVFVPHSLLMP